MGKGGWGVVYLAEDPRLGREVAIKVIRTDELCGNPDAEDLSRRFDVEAKTAAKLHHPGIVAIYDLGVDQGRKFIVMEYVDGSTLRDLIAAAGLAPAGALGILDQVAVALDYAHGMDVVHRDVKPANIMIRKDGVAKVMDFGIAKINLGLATVTPPGAVLGTPPYMSFEHLAGYPAAPDFDRWSFAVTAYEALTGARPFIVDTVTGPEWRGPNGGRSISGNVEAVFARAFDKARDGRYGSCLEFTRALSAAHHTPPPPATEPLSVEALVKQAGQKHQERDHKAAFRLFWLAAEAGHEQAMYNLAVLFETGLGVAKDLSRAREWHVRAARGGIVESMNRLGLLLERGGDGLPPDFAEAIQWYRRASEAGSRSAAANLKRLKLS